MSWLSQRVRRSLEAAACACAAGLLAQAALAQDGPLILRMGTTLTYDSNVFRQPDNAPDPQLARGITGRTDHILSSYAGLRLSKDYSQQHFLLDATETYTRYGKFKSLDRNAYDWRGAWDWHLSQHLSGTLSADCKQSIVGFDDTQDPTPNLTLNCNRGLTFDWWLFGGWHLISGLSRAMRRNSRAFVALPDFVQISEETSLRYIAPSQSSITVTRRSRQGTNTGQAVDFVSFFDNAFTVTESEVNVSWIASVKSTVNGRLTWIERRNEHVSQRDFSGLAGELDYILKASEKLDLNLSLTRNLSPFVQSLASSYKLDQTLAFTPNLRLSDKVSLNARASRLTSDYLGPVVPDSGPTRRDILRTVSLGASWTPTSKITVSATLKRDRRSSSFEGFQFSDTTASVSASLTF